jgi:hypothetical protein
MARRARRKNPAAVALVALRDHPDLKRLVPPGTKTPAAVAMGKLRARSGYAETHRKRWEGVPAWQRSAQARYAVMARWKQYRAMKKAERPA